MPFTGTQRNADGLSSSQRQFTMAVVKGGCKGSKAMIEAWEQMTASPRARLAGMLADLKAGPTIDLAMLSVVLGELRGLMLWKKWVAGFSKSKLPSNCKLVQCEQFPDC